MDTAYDPLTVGLALLAARVVLGALMAAHGTQKLFGWSAATGWGGRGNSWSRWLPGRAFALAAGLSEAAGGLLLLLGFLGPVGPALVLSVMPVAVPRGWLKPLQRPHEVRLRDYGLPAGPEGPVRVGGTSC